MYSKRSNSYLKITGIIILSLLMSQALFAHTVVGELEKMSGKDAAILYLELGIHTYLPFGLDHILFVLSLYLLSPKLKPVLWQATAFTVAHSVTLGLSMYHVIKAACKYCRACNCPFNYVCCIGKYFFTQVKKIKNCGLYFYLGWFMEWALQVHLDSLGFRKILTSLQS